MKLAKEGYFQGNPKLILSTPANIVLEAIKYEAALSDYMNALEKLNEAK